MERNRYGPVEVCIPPFLPYRMQKQSVPPRQAGAVFAVRSTREKDRDAMAEWVKVAEVGELTPGQKKQIDLDGFAVAIFNVDGQYYAIEDVCTHDGAPLASGRFTGHQIACPRHGARFDVCTGKALTMPAVEPVDTYPVKVEGNDILVEVDL